MMPENPPLQLPFVIDINHILPDIAIFKTLVVILKYNLRNLIRQAAMALDANGTDRQANWRNPAHGKLQRGENVVTLKISNVESTALAATLGFDLLWVEMEHSPITLKSLRAIVEESDAVDCIDAGQRHKKVLGRTPATAEKVREFQKQRFQFFQCATELGLMSRGARDLLDPLGIEGTPVEKRRCTNPS
jgi:hypothetical protein